MRFTLCTCLLAAMPVRGAPAPSNGPNTPITTRLKAQFDAADLDHNTYLDKDELAKAFRGPKAKAPEQAPYDDRGQLTQVYYQARSKYPDLVFQWGADKDADGLVSWPEYKDYELKILAAQQQQQQALQRLLQSANRRTATRSSRPGRTVYRGHRSSTYAHATRHVQHLQRSHVSQQQQMVQAVQNWQNQQHRIQTAYQAALRQRLQEQQRQMNYVRQRQATYYRAVQQHVAAVYRAQQRRR